MAGLAKTGEKVLRGIPASGGVCRGKVLVLGSREQKVARLEMTEADVPGQVARFEQALVQSRQQLLELQEQIRARVGAKDADIFTAHLLILEDPLLVDEVMKLITEEKVNAEYALQTAIEKYVNALEQINDELLRERTADLRDVGDRILNNLLGCVDEHQLNLLTEPSIVISHDLTPSTTALLDKTKILGFATDVGSRTSHTAILARSLQIPAVVALKTVSQELATGQQVLLDGYNGLLIINPSDQTLFEYGHLVRRQVTLQEKLRSIKDQPAVTLDGSRVLLSANIEQPSDVEAVKTSGAEGVGLFRTEFIYLNRESAPAEEEQYQAYLSVAEALHPAPVIIRTLDLGGDKFLTHVNVGPETSSFYGWRAIRFCLHRRDIFRTQIRAILRASSRGNVKLMYPMVSDTREIEEANALLAECKQELRAEGRPFDDSMQIGAMIEVPSAVLIADALARRVQFFSIGTNDLIQYTLAVDRMNEHVAHLYQPTHPAILKLIQETVAAAHRQGIWVGVCGEMAGDPVLVPLLLGLGVDELSAAPSVAAQIKFLIRRLKMSEARDLVAFALQCEDAREILERSRQLARSAAPSLFETEL
ncbi:phosphoenolpyruvate--protein phosphotransferase [Fontisphaera persica]|uniref:phosphoenolpyruvate--protein phosphotransferase n=1 Tax=Fontisphaera persica TaxID=2974023 RepID=UPI0024BF13D5|nr:phosphoenolpyruvate--protein phosphotransferase [Fontisphaera persica]WCJ60550.1 phosphoenolpyruvate--protein phosphotransferase [Fontisphaera persica]